VIKVSLMADQKRDQVIQRLKDWAGDQESIRAMLLTSTRANPNADIDLFSDYDVILVVADILPYFEDRSWLWNFGEVLVVYRDPIQSLYGFGKFACITQYEDGTKIDFTFWPVEILRRVIDNTELPPDLDIGYHVLIDKDDITEGMRLPSYRAYIPSSPTEGEYLEAIEVFFHEATYVAKYLWRDDLMAAKYCLDHVMKMKKLRRMLEWRVECDRNWSLRMKDYGRGLKKVVAPEIWLELENTYVGAGVEENWVALFNTIDLMRKLANDIGSRLGYSYPNDLDRRMMVYLRMVKGLDLEARGFPGG
jgi:aminoglycoside 6-adenylyltransferase